MTGHGIAEWFGEPLNPSVAELDQPAAPVSGMIGKRLCYRDLMA